MQTLVDDVRVGAICQPATVWGNVVSVGFPTRLCENVSEPNTDRKSFSPAPFPENHRAFEGSILIGKSMTFCLLRLYLPFHTVCDQSRLSEHRSRRTGYDPEHTFGRGRIPFRTTSNLAQTRIRGEVVMKRFVEGEYRTRSTLLALRPARCRGPQAPRGG